jgi:hypothetical protein
MASAVAVHVYYSRYNSPGEMKTMTKLLERIVRRVPHIACAAILVCPALRPATVAAAPAQFFTTGNPDGLIGTLSRPSSPGVLQTETADDFILGGETQITSATFTGLLPTGASLSSATRVEVEFYHVFPVDSANPPSGNVLTRMNSALPTRS